MPKIAIEGRKPLLLGFAPFSLTYRLLWRYKSRANRVLIAGIGAGNCDFRSAEPERLAG